MSFSTIMRFSTIVRSPGKKIGAAPLLASQHDVSHCVLHEVIPTVAHVPYCVRHEAIRPAARAVEVSRAAAQLANISFG